MFHDILAQIALYKNKYLYSHDVRHVYFLDLCGCSSVSKYGASV